MRDRGRAIRSVVIGLFLLLLPSQVIYAELVMKVLIVNPSETEIKEFDIKTPLPPEVRPEHVIDADGLEVEYDSQNSQYYLVGSIILKPKESVTRRIVLDDIWIIPSENLTSLRRETRKLVSQITNSSYEGQGLALNSSITRRLDQIDKSQDQSFLSPERHISRYRQNLKTLQVIESDLVSLRQLMVMSALGAVKAKPLIAAESADSEGGSESGKLSVLATWKMIFIILALLGVVSLSFFLVWQRQLKQQLAKQHAQEEKAREQSEQPPTPPATTHTPPQS